jgi:hypothetical protein
MSLFLTARKLKARLPAALSGWIRKFSKFDGDALWNAVQTPY